MSFTSTGSAYGGRLIGSGDAHVAKSSKESFASLPRNYLDLCDTSRDLSNGIIV